MLPGRDANAGRTRCPEDPAHMRNDFMETRDEHTVPDTGHNRDVVLQFYRLGLVGRQPRAAFSRYMDPAFIEHKPDVEVPTREGAAGFLQALMDELPLCSWDVVRTLAEGDLVCVHARFVPAPGAPPYAIADIFRLRNGLVIEHWDVVAGPPVGPVNPVSRF